MNADRTEERSPTFPQNKEAIAAKAGALRHRPQEFWGILASRNYAYVI
ncbi:hypothetical protein [Mastigocladopsis repens]|nr:hypothetical protein [Mastigocladopsis repens]